MLIDSGLLYVFQICVHVLVATPRYGQYRYVVRTEIQMVECSECVG